MSLKADITNQMKEAMRAKDMDTLTTIRLVLSEIKNFEIDNGEQDDGVQKIVGRMIKQWKDAINDYKTGGREDLVAEAQQKLNVLEKFMPEQMGEEELKKIVEETIVQVDNPQPGPVTGMVMKKVAGKADGATVSRMIRELLA
jgi:uncharacterized protein YqeY